METENDKIMRLCYKTCFIIIFKTINMSFVYRKSEMISVKNPHCILMTDSKTIVKKYTMRIC